MDRKWVLKGKCYRFLVNESLQTFTRTKLTIELEKWRKMTVGEPFSGEWQSGTEKRVLEGNFSSILIW